MKKKKKTSFTSKRCERIVFDIFKTFYSEREKEPLSIYIYTHIHKYRRGEIGGSINITILFHGIGNSKWDVPTPLSRFIHLSREIAAIAQDFRALFLWDFVSRVYATHCSCFMLFFLSLFVTVRAHSSPVYPHPMRSSYQNKGWFLLYHIHIHYELYSQNEVFHSRLAAFEYTIWFL